MTRNLDRRVFLRTTGVLTAGAALAGVWPRWGLGADAVKLSTPSAEKIGWPIGIEMYTFRSISFYEALGKIAALGVRHVEPGFFLPLDSKQPGLTTSEKLAPESRKEMKQRMADQGISMTNYYADVNTDRDAAVKAFEFAKEMGVKTIVAEPPPEAFDMVEKLCDEYAINLAIHNHPKSPRVAILEAGQRGGGVQRTRQTDWCLLRHRTLGPLRPQADRLPEEDAGPDHHVPSERRGRMGQARGARCSLGTRGGRLHGDPEGTEAQGFQGLMTVEYEHESPQLVDEVAQCLAFVEKTAAQAVIRTDDFLRRDRFMTAIPSKISRRDLLKLTAAGTAVAGLPGLRAWAHTTNAARPGISLQLYSIRDDCAKRFRSRHWRHVAKMGFEAVEFAGYHSYAGNAKGLRKRLDDLGLKVAGTHIGTDQLACRLAAQDHRVPQGPGMQVPDRAGRQSFCRPRQEQRTGRDLQSGGRGTEEGGHVHRLSQPHGRVPEGWRQDVLGVVCRTDIGRRGVAAGRRLDGGRGC